MTAREPGVRRRAGRQTGARRARRTPRAPGWRDPPQAADEVLLDEDEPDDPEDPDDELDEPDDEPDEDDEEEAESDDEEDPDDEASDEPLPLLAPPDLPEPSLLLPEDPLRLSLR
jgi:hypothetical protein